MAKINQQTLVITVSQLLKDGDSNSPTIMTAEMIDSIEAAIQQLAEESTQGHILVEIQQA